MSLEKSIQNWIGKQLYINQPGDSAVMKDIYRVYENVHWIFNNQFSHPETMLHSFECLDENRYKVLLSNGSSFVVKAHNGQELLEQIATQWNLLVKEGRA